MSTEWQTIFGNNVRRHRKAARLTQAQLAFAADIDLTYAGGVECGRFNPSLLIIVRIAAALNVTPATLLERSDGD